jgi:hypothetical protein
MNPQLGRRPTVYEDVSAVVSRREVDAAEGSAMRQHDFRVRNRPLQVEEGIVSWSSSRPSMNFRPSRAQRSWKHTLPRPLADCPGGTVATSTSANMVPKASQK